jgi:hypothetical protein
MTRAIEFALMTDETGAYQFYQLRHGLYSLKIESAGFKAFSHEHSELPPGSVFSSYK